MQNKGLGQRLRLVTLFLAIIICVGTTGYMTIEGWGFVDALYMTIITLTTVGFGETHPLSPIGRIFTMFILVSSVGGGAYLLTVSMEFIVSGDLQNWLSERRRRKMMMQMQDHCIVCGYGRVGQQVVQEFRRAKTPFIVIDNNPTALVECKELGIPYVEGDASSDDILKSAGIERAKSLITAVDSDAQNVFVVLSARGLRSDLFIVARSNLPDSEYKLFRAGANRVLSPYSIGGRRMANLAIRPAVVDFLDVVMYSEDLELILEEVEVHPESSLAGKTLTQAQVRQATGTMVVAIKRADGHLVLNPGSEAIIQPGDRLIALGTVAQHQKLLALA